MSLSNEHLLRPAHAPSWLQDAASTVRQFAGWSPTRRSRLSGAARRNSTNRLGVECLEPRLVFSSLPLVEEMLPVIDSVSDADEVAEIHCTIDETELATTFDAHDSQGCPVDETDETQRIHSITGDTSLSASGTPAVDDHESFEPLDMHTSEADGSTETEQREDLTSVLAKDIPNPGLPVALPSTSSRSIASLQTTSRGSSSDLHVSARFTPGPRQPLYFSGSTTLRPARWKVNPSELIPADSLLETASLNPPSPPAQLAARALNVPTGTDAITETSTASRAPHTALRATRSTQAANLVFAEIQSWIRRDLALRFAHVAFPEQPDSAPDPPSIPAARTESEANSDGSSHIPAEASIPATKGGVSSWHLFGGLGVFQILLNIRHRKYLGRNL